MASRRADWQSVVKRCQDAGWTVIRVGDGWKVYPRDREEFAQTIHESVSDVRAMTRLIADLERKGLAEDEAAAKTQRLLARKQKIAADRAAAEKRTAEILASQKNNATAVMKAAGPYLVDAEEPDLEWLTKAHPAPWMRWMYITPKVASVLLEEYNTDNRHLGDPTSERYAAIILSKQWHLTHQGLAMDTRPLVQDGQHRLRGLVLASQVDPDDPGFGLDPLDFDPAELRIPFAIFVGMPPENFKAIDEGRLRTASQMLKKAGENIHLNTVIRLVAAYKSENPRDFVRKKMYNSAIFEMLEKDSTAYREAALWGQRHYKKTKCPAGPLGAAHYLLYKMNGEGNPYVTAFLEGFAYNRKHGTNLVLPDGDPRRVLLNKFNSIRPTPIEGLLWIIHSWNNLVKGHHLQYMRDSEATAIPDVLICKPGAGVTPRALVGEDFGTPHLSSPFAGGPL